MVHYLAGVDLNDVMSHARLEAAQELQEQIQAAADARNLGAKILFVGLQDIHPPVTVAGDYEKVVGAEQTKLAAILGAQADAIRTNALAERAGVHDDERGRRGRGSGWKSRRLRARRCSRTRFRRSRPRRRSTSSACIFKTFADATANARKYILLVTNTQDVVIFDLKTKSATDLLDLSVAQQFIAMKRNLLTIVIGAVLVVIFALLLFVFQVRQSEVAVVTTFGKPVRNITEPGAYFKWPWPVQKVYKFDQRIQNFEDKFSADAHGGQRHYLMTSVYVGWKISDAANFYPKFPGDPSVSLPQRPAQLESILRNAKSAVIGQHALSEFRERRSAGS